MRFQRLRLAGFKSFVEPTEFRIEPGLTGVVGPNGCGKSNLLEGLRWVMGANSARAMRAGGMDDVIFAGSDKRPGRNHAEVALTIDNAERRAPAAFNDHPVIEVVRRIDRGAGSTYRINGREVRARDVQLLFADASTGASSPALVRQGQISELIAARPQNRRMILEEAAGVSGLHSRRHEAELRLRAAETNLTRLDDVARELEAGLGRLKREARAAERYRKLSAEIRALQSAVLCARWAEAKAAATRLAEEASQAARTVEVTSREAARSSGVALEADAAMAPLREASTIAVAVLNKLAIDKDRLDRETEAHAAELARLAEDLARIESDQARETQIAEDAAAALLRLGADLHTVLAEIADAPARAPELEAAARAAETARAAADAEVERLAGVVASEDAGRTSAIQRLEAAEARASRTRRALDQARGERAALALPADDPAAVARTRFEEAEGALTAARAALETAEDARSKAASREQAARETARKADEQLGRLTAEARALAGLVAQARRGGFAPALESVSPEKGLEAALAAALGDDLDAALDPASPAHWGGRDPPPPPAWPKGATPIAPLIRAPAALAGRLAYVALVDRADGERLCADLAPGARLVSREGDLWRWDGFTVRAEAPRPAAVRLEQKTRLAGLEAEIEGLTPGAETARTAAADAQTAARDAEEAARGARRAIPELEAAAVRARSELETLDRNAALAQARAGSLDDLISRFEAEYAEHVAERDVAAQSLGALTDSGAAAALTIAREAALEARTADDAARAALAEEFRAHAGRARRREMLESERADWTRRADSAARRLTQLVEARARAHAALAQLREAPTTLDARRARLLDELSVAEARRAGADDALAVGESARTAAERALRAADSAAAEAREARAGLTAHAEAAAQRLTETAQAIREAARLEPEELARKLTEEAVAIPADPEGVEAHLFGLERQRDAIGPVNLRAETDATDTAQRLETLNAERTDLSGAVTKLRQGIDELNQEGRERLTTAFGVINEHFKTLFQALFQGGQAELRLIESDDPLEAGLEIYACPPGKRLASMSLLSGGEQALTAAALIFAVFLANPAPICVLDEVDAPLDDANVDRFCNLLDEMCRRTETRFVVITHNPVTMARTDRLFGVTMAERGVSQLVSVDLRQAEAMAAQ